MPFINEDWSFTRSSGDLRYIGDTHSGASPSYATTIELHRALQDFADNDSSTGDDELDITDPNPSSRLGIDNIVELLNGVNIDDASSQHIYDGSIIQDGGDVIYDGFQNFGQATRIQIIQNGQIIPSDFWNESGGLNPDQANGVSHRFMLKVRNAGNDIDGRRVIATSRVFGQTYQEFVVNSTSRGNNTLALNPANDNFNNTDAGVVAGWTDITNSNEGINEIDVSGDGVGEFYYSNWSRGERTINEATERWKWLTRDGSGETLYGLPGELFRGVTHQWGYDNETGDSFDVPDLLTWSGGTAQLLAVDDDGDTGVMWVQLLTGNPPSEDELIAGDTSGATATVNGTVTSRAISAPFFGASTGSAIIGAFGFGIVASDLTARDSVIDLANITNNPPNNVQFTVNGTSASVGQLLVGPWDGSAVDVQGNPEPQWEQMRLAETQDNASTSTLEMATAIPLDTPAIGTIRVTLDNGRRKRIAYTSYSDSTFVIQDSDFSTVNASANNGVAVTYVDRQPSSSSESFTVVYQSDRPLVVLHRDGGGSPEREFISSSVIGANGGSINLIRVSDE